jgi:hypothetical protein
LKLVLQNDTEIRDLYKLAQEHKVQIRRLNFKRDSLEDIFLKAMEGGNGWGLQAPGAPGDAAQAAGLRGGKK